MKTPPILAAASYLLALSAPAQNATAPQEEIPISKQAHALLIYDARKFEEAWITKATPTEFLYRVTPNAIDRKRQSVATCAAIYFYEPSAYHHARDLYQARRFDDARKEFVRIREALQDVRDLPNNYATLAGYYELECLRHLGDLEALKKATEGFHKEALTREDHIRQIDLYVLWDAVRTKSWQRIDLICQERRKQEMPGYQRVQVAYCHGLALEALEMPVKALNAYAAAIVADYGASVDLVRKAALNSLRIYSDDEEVQLAMNLWGTDDEDKNSTGHFRMMEAGALAKTYKVLLGQGKGLPEEYAKFLKYAPKGQSTAVEAPKPKATEKNATPKADTKKK